MLQLNNEKQFKVNDFITLKLENDRTNVYVKEKPFNQCKHLLLNLDKQNLENYDSIDSIDEAIEVLHDPQYPYLIVDQEIPPETEFWGHCSNLQAWVENDYDTRLLHRNIAFPLLKKLTEVGDPIAKRRFKEEIAIRFQSGHISVMNFLIQERYLDYLNPEEINFLCDNLIESSIHTKEQIEKPKLGLILDTLSRFLIKTKNITEIIEIYESLFMLEPHSLQIWKRFTRFYTSLIKSQIDPLPSFLPSFLLNPKSIDFWKNIGYFYFFKGEFSKSVNAFEKTLELEALSIPVLITLMLAYERELEIDKSIKICDILIQTLPENQNYQVLNNYFYLKKYLHLSPIEIYDKVIEIAPLVQKLLFQENFIAKKTSDINIVLERLTKLSERNPKNIIIWNLLTLGFICNRDFYNAIKAQLKLLELKYKKSLIYANLSYLYYLKNDFVQAISYCEMANECDPDRPDWWVFITKLHWKVGNVKEAIRFCKCRILEKRTSIQMQNQLCILFLHSRKYDDAIVMCNKLLKREVPFSSIYGPPKTYSAYLLLDNSLKKKKVNIEDYEYATTWKNLGYAYYKKRFFKRALIAFNNSLTLNPIQPLVYYFISKIELMN